MSSLCHSSSNMTISFITCRFRCSFHCWYDSSVPLFCLSIYQQIILPLLSFALSMVTLFHISTPLAGQTIVFAIANLLLIFRLWNPALPSLSSLTAPLLLISSCSWAQSAMLHTCETWSLLSLHWVISVVFSSILNHHSILFTVLLFKQNKVKFHLNLLL